MYICGLNCCYFSVKIILEFKMHNMEMHIIQILTKRELLYRLWEAGWKQRYYKNKFDVDVSDKKFRRKVVQSYVEGLCWVLRYYYQVLFCSAVLKFVFPQNSLLFYL